MRSLVKLIKREFYPRITVISRSKADRGDMRFFPISNRSARPRLEYTFTISNRGDRVAMILVDHSCS